MCSDDVGVFREALGVVELSLEVGAARVGLADGLDNHSVPGNDILGYPGGAVRPLAGLLLEDVTLVEAKFCCSHT